MPESAHNLLYPHFSYFHLKLASSGTASSVANSISVGLISCAIAFRSELLALPATPVAVTMLITLEVVIGDWGNLASEIHGFTSSVQISRFFLPTPSIYNTAGL